MYKIVVEIPEGWGSYFSGPKVEILGRTGGLTRNSLRGGGMDSFWNYTLELFSSSKHGEQLDWMCLSCKKTRNGS